MSRRDGMHAVLFDMDGLLVDTEATWYAAECAVMDRLGGPWGPEYQAALVGGPLRRAAEFMVEVAGSPVGPDTVAGWLVEEMAGRLREGVSWRPGARDLLEALTAEAVPRALVSASYRVLVDAVLDGVGRHHFAVTVAGDEVRHTKPHPEPYLRAAGLLGADPARCVVLEDSPTGVAAAEAAGCVTVAVPSVVPIPAGDGRTVVGSLRELRPADLRDLVIRRLGGVHE